MREIWRSVKSYGKTRSDMAEGCKEQLDFKFAKWIWDYPTHNKPDMLRRLASIATGKKVIILRSAKEVEEFLAAIHPHEL